MMVLVRLSAFIMLCIVSGSLGKALGRSWQELAFQDEPHLSEIKCPSNLPKRLFKVGKSPTQASFTNILPILFPSKSPMKAPSAWSSPSATVSLFFSLPDCR